MCSSVPIPRCLILRRQRTLRCLAPLHRLTSLGGRDGDSTGARVGHDDVVFLAKEPPREGAWRRAGAEA